VGAVTIRAPERLNHSHDISEFDCGEKSLTEWLKRRAIQNQQSGAAVTYVVAVDTKVVGYYCLSSGSVARNIATKRAGRNMPDAVPAMLLGRLAVDRAYQSRGIGCGMLRDAVLRVISGAKDFGIRVMLVHALPTAKAFYQRLGFQSSPVFEYTMMITIEDAIKQFQLSREGTEKS
jgi:predicted N-acetyltransferase YhbS